MKPSLLWLAVTIPVLVGSVLVLAKTVGGMVRTLRKSTIISVPLAREQSVVFAEHGRLDLYLEGRRGTNFSGLEFELTDPAGRPIPLDSAVLRTTVSGLSRVRVKIRSLELPREGQYILGVTGLAAHSDPDNRVVFARPIGGLLVGRVLAILGLSFLILGSIAGSILPFVSRR